MKKLLLFALPVILLACANKNGTTVSENSAPKPTDLPQASEKITVKTGETFEIRLGSIPGTGYTWEFRKPLNETLLESVSKTYQQKVDEEGMPGEDVFIFKALQSGTTEIVLWYIRPWMTNNETNPDIDTRVYEIMINES